MFGVLRQPPPGMKTREEIKIDKARGEQEKFKAQEWRQTKVVG